MRTTDYRTLYDRLFRYSLRGVSGLGVGLMFGILGTLLILAWPAIQKFGWSFLVTNNWDPVAKSFGVLPFVFGTLTTSLLALLIAGPVGVGSALFLTEVSPAWVRRIVGFLLELMAAIPSVCLGLWGVFVLAPWVREFAQPKIQAVTGDLGFFSGPPYGVGIFTAALILAMMILPTIAALSKEVFQSIPRSYREAAMALGATRWETMKVGVLQTARPGLLGALFLGLARAMGETMAVTMVIGNRNEIEWSIFAPAQTMSSLIANEYAEAAAGVHLASLAWVGLVLFGMSFCINLVARHFVLSSQGGSHAS
jgi:phosphate transport system permease protein